MIDKIQHHMKKVLALHQKQDQYQLLRYSVESQPTFLGRTVPPHNFENAAQVFDGQVYRALAELMDTNLAAVRTIPMRPSVSWPRSLGGLGLAQLNRSHRHMYLASVLSAKSTLLRVVPATRSDLSAWFGLPSNLSIMDLTSAINQTELAIAQLKNIKPSTASTRDSKPLIPKSVRSIMQFNPPKNLQHKITSIIYTLQFETMIKSLSSASTTVPPTNEAFEETAARLRKLAFIRSKASPGAAVFLNALPSSNLFRFNNAEFAIALRLYTGMTLLDKANIQSGSRCACSFPLGVDVPVSDQHVMLCRLSGGLSKRHNHVRDTFAEMFRAAKFDTTIEPNIGAGSRRADLKVVGFDGQAGPAFFDVTVVNPLQKDYTNVHYSKQLAVANKAANDKAEGYKTDIQASGNPRYIPLAFESTGGVQRLVLDTIEICSKRFSSEMPEDATWVCSKPDQYWLQAISCALWRGNAKVVLSFFDSVRGRQGARHMLPPDTNAAGLC